MQKINIKKQSQSEWANKVLSIIKTSNWDGAMAQIKVAPSVKDLNHLKAALLVGDAKFRPTHFMNDLDDHIGLLSAPRLHRSP